MFTRALTLALAALLAAGGVAGAQGPVTSDVDASSSGATAPQEKPVPALLEEPAPAQPEEAGMETVVSERAVAAQGSVQQVDRRAIERSGAATAVEVLETLPALHASTGSRGERIFSLRGFEQRQVAVLLDGAPASIPYDGQVDLAMLPAAMIERITVIKGPSTVIHGPGGLGGAVNIITRRPGHGPLLETQLGYGRGPAVALQALHAHRVGRLGYTIYGGLRRSDGFPLASSFRAQPGENGALRENSDRRLVNLGARAGLDLGPRHRLEAGLALVDGTRGVPPGTLEPLMRFWRFSVWRGLSLTVGHRGRYPAVGALEVDEVAYATLYDNLLDSYDDASYSTQLLPRAFSSWYHDRTYGGRVRARFRTARTPWGPTALRLWTSLQHERHANEEDGELDHEESRTLLTVAPEAEAFLGQRWRLQLAWQTDVELPHGAGQQTDVGWGPLLSLRFTPLDGLELRASGGHRTRFPTLKERFSGAEGAREPNPDLGPEGAWHMGLELGWRPRPWVGASLMLFDAEVDDLIELVHKGAGITQLRNTGAARLLGAELELELAPWRWGQLSLGYGWLRATHEDSGDPLQYRPAHKVTLGAGARPLRWLELAAQLRVVGQQHFLHPLSDAPGRLGAYTVLDARAVVRPFPWIDLHLTARNLLDSNYQTELGYPDPGQVVWVGVTVRTGS